MAAAAVTARRPTDKAMGGGGCAGGGAEGAGAALPSVPPVSARATSASGLLALLAEPEPELVGAALRGLDAAVPQFWFEIAQSIGALEAVAEDEASPHRELASLVASKVFYHLGELDDALRHALGAGPLFDVSSSSDHAQAVLAAGIDSYVAARSGTKKASSSSSSSAAPPEPIDQRLTALVERLFDRCLRDGQAEQGVGVALDARRLDRLAAALRAAPDPAGARAYCLRVAQALVPDQRFRDQVLRLLVELHHEDGGAPLLGGAGGNNGGTGAAAASAGASPDVRAVAQCLVALDDSQALAALLTKLLRSGNDDDVALALQVGFDLHEAEEGPFAARVLAAMEEAAPKRPVAPPPPATPAAAAGAAGATGGDAMDADGDDAAPGAPAKAPAEEGPSDAAATADAAAAPAAAAAAPAPPPLSPEDARHRDSLDTLARVLSGAAPTSLTLEFMHSAAVAGSADSTALLRARQAVEPRNSVCHGAVVFANAATHAGTTVDAFLRDNLDWLARATNWAKFSATAGLGVIHRGHVRAGRSLMAPYLPRGGGSGSGSSSSSSSPFSEGGALFALGLLGCGTTAPASPDAPFLLNALRGAAAEPVQHGAALGLGAAALGTADAAASDELRGLLYADSAVGGEGAALALGLLHAGAGADLGGGAAGAPAPASAAAGPSSSSSAQAAATPRSTAAAELLAYAHDTQHEKIIRACGVGAALCALGQGDLASDLVERLSADPDPLLRYGGAFATGLAFAGTASPAAVGRLLTAAVRDVSDDVRRAAVLNLGFVLAGEGAERVAAAVAPLSQSFNPHVRYGAAMALGVGCACGGARAALDALAPLLDDPVDFVRQGALVASALVLMQQPAAVAAPLRAALARSSTDKHEETMCRMGAIMATGIVDAGGRNARVQLLTPGGRLRKTAAVGLAMFVQYWYWYPLSYFFGVALSPSALVPVEPKELRTPRVELSCECRESLFRHPEPAPAPVAATARRAAAAVLSTTARAAARAREKERAKGISAVAPMDEGGEDKKKKTEDGGNEAEGEKKQPEEPAHYSLFAPARVAPAQARFVRWPKGSRWAPVPAARGGAAPALGFVVVRDRTPGEPVEWAAGAGAAAAAAAAGAGAPGAASAAAAPAAAEPAPPAAIDLASA